MKPKTRRKLVILLGYQMSNLAWFGAWWSLDPFPVFLSPPFVFFVFLICLADAFIIWKELE